MAEPLASYLRPTDLDSFFGQGHLLGENSPISVFIKSGNMPSMIFRGPPGVGKTTLANIIAKKVNAQVFYFSGVTSKKEDLIKISELAKKNFAYGIKTIIFLDEIHRRNKAQQDTLLPFVEKGTLILIGATTENPSFTINNALLSRCRVFTFNKLSGQEVFDTIKKNMPKIMQKHNDFELDDKDIHLIAELSNGDLRNAFNILEASLSSMGSEESRKVTRDVILRSCERTIYHDRNGEEHYNIISAIHKSLRDSDPDAACYWVQRMLYAGEDPLYVARRLLRFASEDIGIADNNALILANNVYESVQKIGMPECEVFLFQLAIYLAKAPKNNSAYITAIKTKEDVIQFGNLPVPMHIRNAPTKLMKELGYGDGYKYAHDFKDAKVEQEHFPEQLKGRKYIED